MSNITKLLMLLGIGLLLAAASIYFIGGKPKSYSVSTDVNARPQQLFPYLVETDLKKQWLTTIVDEVLVPSEEDIQNGNEPVYDEGVAIDCTLQLEGETLQMEGEVIRFRRDQLAAVKFSDGNINITYFFRLKPKTNSTEVEYRKIIRHRGLSRFTAVFNDDNQNALLEQQIGRLVKLVESGQGSEVDLEESDESAEQ